MTAPELRLKVTLDTSFLKAQISRLPLDFVGTNVSIRPKFDRQIIVNEFRLLSRYIGSKKFNVTIASNLEKEIQAADRLVLALQRVQQASGKAQGGLPLGTKGLSKTAGQAGLSATEIKTLFNASIQGGLLDEKTLGKTRAQMVAALGAIGRDSIKGLLNGLESDDAKLQQAAQTLGKSLIRTLKDVLGIASPSKEFKKIGDDVGKGFELGAVASMDRAFDALESKIRERLSKLQAMLQRDPSRRGAFPHIASGGLLESAPLARELDQAYAQLARIQERRQGRLSSERTALARSSGMLLPAGVSTVPVTKAQEVVLSNFLTGMRNANRTLRQHFAANSYLPRATKALSGAMDQAAVGIKALPGTRGPIAALPSSEMLSQRKFQSAAEKAAQIDAANAAREQARKASEQGALREMFKGVPAISAPMIGAENAPLSRAASYMLNKTNRILGLPSGPSSPIGSMGQFPMAGMAGRGSMGQFPMSGMLGLGSMGQFPMSGMAYPSSPLGRITPQSSMFAGGGGGGMPPSGGGGGGGGVGSGGRGRQGFGGGFNVPDLPGTGLIREMGQEFTFATKQVFLFGAAYKALAIMQNFPRQVGAAVGSLQSFRNTLNAISPTAQEAALSNQLILGLVERYNIPLESARQGFTKLYASMQPAGFSGTEISKLFTGISKASATLGLSADKVDRVTYAFSQMASKGQLMSEEVSGQLGDVIPGALSIMAEAAGMGIGQFKKAMEDGEFVGKRFTEVMNKVPDVLEKRFSKGAEGAAKTFQGAMNNMQNATKLFYESFEPAAVAFLNTFVNPISRQLKDLADGFQAFFAGTQAQTLGGQGIADELNRMRPAFEGVMQNIKAFAPTLQLLGDIALTVAKAFTVLIGNPIVGFLAKTYAQVLLLTTAFNLLTANAIARTITSLVSMVFQLRATNQAMIGTQVQMALLRSNAGGLTAAFNSGALAVAGLGAAIKTALLGGIVTAAILLIDQLINRIQQLRAESDAVKARGKGARAEVKAAYAGGVESGRGMAAQKEAEARSASRMSGIYRNLAEGKKISAEDLAFYEEQGGDASLLSKPKAGATRKFKQLRSEFERLSLRSAQTAESLRAGIAQGSREGEQAAAAQAARTQKDQQQSAPVEAGKSKTKEKERESQIPVLQLELATTEQLFEIERQIMTARLGGNELELVRLNGLKEQLRLNEQIAKVKLDNDLPAAEKALQIQQLLKQVELARLQTSFELEEKIAEAYQRAQDAVMEIGKQAAAELSDKQEYERLVTEGVLPSVAKITVETNRQFAAELEKLSLLETQIKDQIAILEAKKNITAEDKKQLDIFRKRLQETRGAIQQTPMITGEAIQSRVEAERPKGTAVSLREEADELRTALDKLLSTQEVVKFSAKAIGEAFSTSFKNAITGAATAQEALAGFFQSVGNAFADMAAQMIQKMIQIYILDQFLKILPGAAGAFTGDASIKGGGFGSFSGGDFSAGGVPGLPGLGGAGALANGDGMPSYAGVKFANGGIALGGFKSFANGGMVTGPTMGLVGEGRYNEAIVPLPNGKSIPVELGGAAGNQMNTSIVVNVNNGQAQSNATGSNSSELGRKIEGAVKQVIVGELRPGGLLAR